MPSPVAVEGGVEGVDVNGFFDPPLEPFVLVVDYLNVIHFKRVPPFFHMSTHRGGLSFMLHYSFPQVSFSLSDVNRVTVLTVNLVHNP